MEFVFVRCALAVLAVLLIKSSRCNASHQLFGPQQARIWILLRGFVGSISTMMYFFAVRMLPLGNTTSIAAASPAVTLVLSKCFLNEEIGLRQIFLVIFVIAGAVLIAKPSFLFGGNEEHGAGIGYLLATISCATYGFIFVVTKKAVRAAAVQDINLELLLSYNTFTAIIGLICGLIIPGQSFVMPDRQMEFTAMFVLTVIGLLVHFSYNFGAKHLDASVVSVITTTECIWAYMLQIILFNQKPDLLSSVGAVMIFVAITLITYLKSRSRRSPNNNFEVDDSTVMHEEVATASMELSDYISVSVGHDTSGIRVLEQEDFLVDSSYDESRLISDDTA
mmetsp:Transcript_7683/g.14308  ORF Transcript_7683/g.14308 Transcript_7683/m.14308 type:complete len:336 (+) Transcript_7683:249-1256(+)